MAYEVMLYRVEFLTNTEYERQNQKWACFTKSVWAVPKLLSSERNTSTNVWQHTMAKNHLIAASLQAPNQKFSSHNINSKDQHKMQRYSMQRGLKMNSKSVCNIVLISALRQQNYHQHYTNEHSITIQSHNISKYSTDSPVMKLYTTKCTANTNNSREKKSKKTLPSLMNNWATNTAEYLNIHCLKMSLVCLAISLTYINRDGWFPAEMQQRNN